MFPSQIFMTFPRQKNIVIISHAILSTKEIYLCKEKYFSKTHVSELPSGGTISVDIVFFFIQFQNAILKNIYETVVFENKHAL